jgi:ribosomal protein S18 acetylase RimI-like enzyme
VPDDVALRPGTTDDTAFILDLGARTLAASVSPHRPAPIALVRHSYERLVAFARDQSHFLVIAESALERVGFALAVDALPDEVTGLPQSFVAYMAVEPHARRRGIGRALLGAVEEAARRSGVPHVALMVTEDNVSARQLYAQAGYVTERRLLCKAL